ncbi:MAG: hypothetical protein KBD12_00970 [Candidatus Pacebacteria bacterium]|nr:hypothetical protein [Candidatus Paceibacterota bacterium]
MFFLTTLFYLRFDINLTWKIIFILFFILIIIYFYKKNIKKYTGKIYFLEDKIKLKNISRFPNLTTTNLISTPLYGYTAFVKIKIKGVEIKEKFKIFKEKEIKIGDELEIIYINLFFIKRKLILY